MQSAIMPEFYEELKKELEFDPAKKFKLNIPKSDAWVHRTFLMGIWKDKNAK